VITRIYSIIVGSIGIISCSTLVGSKDTAKPESATKITDGQQVSVSQLYNDTCSKCHGVNAEGGGGGTKSLINFDKYDQKWDKPFFDTIKNGAPNMGMEAYGQTMSEKAIWALVVHLRELQAKGLRAQFGSPKPSGGVYSSKRHNFRIETILDQSQGLKTPWAIDWLPDGKMLVTNLPGTMFIAEGSKVIGKIEGLPATATIGQGGLMDVAVHPDYANNGWIYIAYAEPKADDPKAGLTKIVRGKLKFTGKNAQWTGQQTVFEADQQFYTSAGIHFGSRIVFDGKGHVFFVVGERGGNMLAQELGNPFGKIYRTNEDGSIPADNPFAKQPGPKHVGAIWSYGHRNPQGLVIDLAGNLWDTEHAPRGGDEVNMIAKGSNYGWPVICFGINYNDSPFQVPWPTASQKMSMPTFRWLPSIGACGLDVVRGNAFPQWKGDLVAGGLSGQNVDRIRVSGDKLVEREELIQGMGRVRDVMTGPDGNIYVVLNQPDIVIRLAPAK